MGVITHWLEADELPRCQHCPNLADERSFMCEDCSGQADEERDDLAEQLRGAVEEIEKTAREHCHCAAEITRLKRDNATLRARLAEYNAEASRWALRWATDDRPTDTQGAVEEIEKTAREHCHCAAEPGPCSVCRARGYLIARDAGGQ